MIATPYKAVYVEPQTTDYQPMINRKIAVKRSAEIGCSSRSGRFSDSQSQRFRGRLPGIEELKANGEGRVNLTEKNGWRDLKAMEIRTAERKQAHLRKYAGKRLQTSARFF